MRWKACARKAPPATWAAVATAHPAKFDTVVEPLIGRHRALPDPGRVARAAGHAEPLPTSYDALRERLLAP